MHDEAEVRLVESHTERGRCDQGLDPVGQEIVLRLLPVCVLGTAGVGATVCPHWRRYAVISSAAATVSV
ncbi:hypothetical protein [Streptomyces sp. NPDC005096]|uniref:hypothetical protein n=1 Tax=Streptomyces sp. NPDC005096 TaxID=3154559 RepID=UPI0033BD2DC7